MSSPASVGQDQFLRIFENWLATHKHDGSFYKDKRGWFILKDKKKVYMPSHFQKYQELLANKS